MVSLGHIDYHMPAPDGTGGAQIHDPWVLRHGLLTTEPSVRTGVQSIHKLQNISPGINDKYVAAKLQ